MVSVVRCGILYFKYPCCCALSLIEKLGSIFLLVHVRFDDPYHYSIHPQDHKNDQTHLQKNYNYYYVYNPTVHMLIDCLCYLGLL